MIQQQLSGQIEITELFNQSSRGKEANQREDHSSACQESERLGRGRDGGGVIVLVVVVGGVVI